MGRKDAKRKQEAEETLRESAQLFRLLAENARDIIYRYRLQPRRGFEYVSPSATEITGYSPEEFYANPELYFELVHPEDRHLLEGFMRLPNTSTPPCTIRLRRKDGRMIWGEQHHELVYDAEGEIVAIEGIIRDITRYKEVEEDLRFQKNLLEAQSEASVDGILVLSADHRKIISFNRRFVEMWGRTIEHVYRASG